MTNLLWQFLCLQVLDVGTTLVFPLVGLEEGNPLFRRLAGCTGSMLGGLLAVKGMGAVLAVYCWRARHAWVLRRANLFYAAVVTWNLFALLLKSVVPG